MVHPLPPLSLTLGFQFRAKKRKKERKKERKRGREKERKV